MRKSEALSILANWHINQALKPFNLRLEPLTTEKSIAARLGALSSSGHFERPAFPVAKVFEASRDQQIFEALRQYEVRFREFEDASRNDVGYSFHNDYFTSPDGEVLYTVVRMFQLSLIVEIGSGYSTQIMRQALLDGDLETRLISIDPQPRIEIDNLADKVYRVRVESLRAAELRGLFKAGDILFIDSSHSIEIGNDVVFLYLILLPKLPPGVLIHIHDVFLPYDYPERWMLAERVRPRETYLRRALSKESADRDFAIRRKWNEQYLVQVLLMFGDSFEVIWPGHFLQRSRADFGRCFPHSNGREATSLWLRKTA